MKVESSPFFSGILAREGFSMNGVFHTPTAFKGQKKPERKTKSLGLGTAQTGKKKGRKRNRPSLSPDPSRWEF